MKKIYITILSTFFIFLFANTAYAATEINEIEPNGSTTQAQVIVTNNEKPAELIKANATGTNYVHGNISDRTDEDFYKVFLSADNKNILSIANSAISGTGIFEVYDEDLNLITSINYKKNSLYSVTPYYVNIPKSGYYYVKVHSSLLTGDYYFYIGGPHYQFNNYEYTASSALTLTPAQKSVQAIYDFSNISSIPDNAIIWSVNLNGTKTNYASNQYRSIKIDGDSSWITTGPYVYTTNVSPTSNVRAKSKWVYKLDGNVSKSQKYFSLIPKISFSYMYPVLPELLGQSYR